MVSCLGMSFVIRERIVRRYLAAAKYSNLGLFLVVALLRFRKDRTEPNQFNSNQSGLNYILSVAIYTTDEIHFSNTMILKNKNLLLKSYDRMYVLANRILYIRLVYIYMHVGGKFKNLQSKREFPP